MRATFRKYSRHWLVHAIIVALAILVGVIVFFKPRPTRGQFDGENKAPLTCRGGSVPPGRAWVALTNVSSRLSVVRPIGH